MNKELHLNRRQFLRSTGQAATARERPNPAQVLKDVNWDLWLGPAPKIAWNERHFGYSRLGVAKLEGN